MDLRRSDLRSCRKSLSAKNFADDIVGAEADPVDYRNGERDGLYRCVSGGVWLI